MTRGPSDLLAVLLMARDAGVEGRLDVVPLFETVADLHAAPGHDGAPLREPGLRPAPRRPRRGADDHGGVQRLQQGRRLPHRELGAAQGAARARGGLPPRGRRAHPLPRPGRDGGPRRRADEPRDPGPAAGVGGRAPAAHRAGRVGDEPLREPRPRAAPPRAARPRGARGRRPPARGQPVARRRLGGRAPRAVAARRGRVPRLVQEAPAGALERYLRAATPLDEIERLNIGSRPARRAPAAGSRTCGRSRGCSPGPRAG